MTVHRNVIAAVLVFGGALLFAMSLTVLLLPLLYPSLSGTYTGTYLVVPVAVPIIFVAGSLLVLAGSIAARCRVLGKAASGHRRACVAAMLLTAAAWCTLGASFAVAGAWSAA